MIVKGGFGNGKKEKRILRGSEKRRNQKVGNKERKPSVGGGFSFIY